MRQRILTTVLCIMMLLGCSTSPKDQPANRTPDGGPGRDTSTAKSLHAEALDLLEEGDRTKAEAKLRAAIDADLTFGPAHNNLGKLLYDQGQLYQAAWQFQYAIKLMPYQPEPRNNLGLVLERAGKLDEAVDHYREALKIQPDNPELIGNLARAKHQRGDKDDEQRELLQDLILKDTRPQWRAWAREQANKLSNP